MAAARIDGSVAIAQRTARAAARDDARSAVLGRFDAADSRRRFSLETADEARAGRAASLARSRAEIRDDAAKRETSAARHDVPTAEHRDRAAEGRAPDLPGKVTRRSESGGGRSATTRGAADGPGSKSVAETEPAATSGPAAEAVDGESAASAEAKPGAETATPAVSVAAPLSDPAAPAPGLAEAPSAGLPDAAPAAGRPQVQTAVDSLAEPTGRAIAEVGGLAREAAQQPAGTVQASPPDGAAQASPPVGIGADVSVLPASAETPPAAGATTPASAPAKAAASSDVPAAPASSHSAAPPVPLGAVPMTIALRSLQNASRFEIRLDPVELGRIDVRLDIDKDSGTVSADLVVDRPATLALLQRDAGALQQALSQAGLDASAGIGLSLRDADGGGQDGGQEREGRASPQPPAATPGIRRAGEAIEPLPLRTLRLSGLDIRI